MPVYWGASNIADYVPKEAFIDRRGFGSDEELFAHLKAIGRAEYESYLAAAQNFFSSPEAQRFSSENFVQTVLDEIRRVAP